MFNDMYVFGFEQFLFMYMVYGNDVVELLIVLIGVVVEKLVIFGVCCVVIGDIVVVLQFEFMSVCSNVVVGKFVVEVCVVLNVVCCCIVFRV